MTPDSLYTSKTVYISKVYVPKGQLLVGMKKVRQGKKKKKRVFAACGTVGMHAEQISKKDTEIRQEIVCVPPILHL